MRCLLCAALVVVLSLGCVYADTIISTLPIAGSATFIGEPTVATFGQTFTVAGSDTSLKSFSFWLQSSVGPDAVDFAAYVMAWEGSKATGPELYKSSLQHLFYPTNTWQQFEFDTGGIPLNQGSKYVAFLSASEYFDGVTGAAAMATASGDVYAGGAFVNSSNGNDISLLSQYWDYTGWYGGDTAFIADLGAPGDGTGGSTPELPPIALLSALPLGLAWLRRRAER